MTALIYRKSGKTIRAEFSRGSLALFSISESGIAREDGQHFSTEPADVSFHVAEPDPRLVRDLVSELRQWNPERFTILTGNAEYEMEGRRWSESLSRIHITLTSHNNRVSLDLGADSLKNLDLEPVRIAATAMLNLKPLSQRISSITLSPNVAASLWSVVVSLLPNRIRQSTHPGFRFDGDGHEIGEASFQHGWPNRYRPSYRARPRHTPFHLRADWPAADTHADCEAIAVIEPFTIFPEAVSSKLLFVRGNEAFTATLRLRLVDLTARTTVAGDPHWYPFGAGSYGSTTQIDGVRLAP